MTCREVVWGCWKVKYLGSRGQQVGSCHTDSCSCSWDPSVSQQLRRNSSLWNKLPITAFPNETLHCSPAQKGTENPFPLGLQHKMPSSGITRDVALPTVRPGIVQICGTCPGSQVSLPRSLTGTASAGPLGVPKT